MFVGMGFIVLLLSAEDLEIVSFWIEMAMNVS